MIPVDLDRFKAGRISCQKGSLETLIPECQILAVSSPAYHVAESRGNHEEIYAIYPPYQPCIVLLDQMFSGHFPRF